ncbi:hypothetical protein JR316_0002648 [Psilocybe cubensis]|uniref:Uncharacterized protein n=2 Tax=Psilocybe cubensis TaxID=181762 RepID=A0ACB8HCJ6_PSICU|nr:hypothetical protein JR316_0002648 [Psilocybe cubensis]KAH9485733.1 hypothetical protein JR316_0002648 [Psilocybe cubensis]
MSLWGSPVELPSTSPENPVPSSVNGDSSRPRTPHISSPAPNSTDSREPNAGPSNEAPVARLDGLFNFQIVVFQVENTLFQVLKNGFMVPGTPFEAMFALPTPSDDDEQPFAEGDSLTNPIFLPGVVASEFRAFLKILYPFMGPSVVTSYEDWVGILNLATMWEFTHVRASLNQLDKPIPERIILGRTYRVVDWLKDEYITLAQNPNLDIKNLRDPSGIQLDWETIAKIMFVRDKNMLTNLRQGRSSSGYHCGTCNIYYGYHHEVLDCRCRIKPLIEEGFQEEFQDLAGAPSGGLNTSPPLPTST